MRLTQMLQAAMIPSLVVATSTLQTGCEFYGEAEGGACVGAECNTGVCPEGSTSNRFTGTVTLESRTLYGDIDEIFDNYEAATFSFEHAAQWDDGQVLNDWDLLFSNDYDPWIDWFVVNMVVDDASFIVDIGPVSVCEVPLVVDPDVFPAGAYGGHDNVQVLMGHTYVVRTIDSSTRQIAAFTVIDYVPDCYVTIQWYLSPDPDRFIPRPECRE
jgi:hypothetical protein